MTLRCVFAVMRMVSWSVVVVVVAVVASVMMVEAERMGTFPLLSRRIPHFYRNLNC